MAQESWSRQQIFDEVARHLLKQNARSENGYGVCCYRNGQSEKCAIGCLIRDDEYKHEMENKGLTIVFGISPTLAERLGGKPSLGFLNGLQGIHDHEPVEIWRQRLREFASDWNVDSAVLEEKTA